MRAGRLVTVGLLVFLVVLVNAPLVRTLWDDWRLSADGVTERVAVLDSTDRGPDQYLRVALDPDQVVRVDQATYDAALAAGQVEVRRRSGSQAVRVAGQVRSPAPYVVTVALDLALLAGVVLVTRVRTRLRPELVLRAGEDPVAAEPGSVLDRVEGLSYVVAGVVLPAEPGDDDEVVLDLGDRRVRVDLDGHTCRVPPGDTARVVGVMIA